MARNEVVRRVMKDMRTNYELYAFVLPAMIVIFIFNYIPMYGLQIAFKDFVPSKGITGSEWAGLKYFFKFFESYQFSTVVWNTISINLYALAVAFPLPIVLALILNQVKNQRLKRITQTVTYFPHFMSVVVVVGMLLIFLSPTNGLVANIAKLFGFVPINFIGEASWFKTIYVFSDIWQNAGWDCIIFLAALSAVDTQLYDASSVDGASKWRKIWHIDIPALVPVIVILLILRSGSIMSLGFEKMFLMQNSLNLISSEVISTYEYKIGILSAQYSYSAAIGFFNNIVNFVVLLLVNQLARKLGDNSLL